MMDEQFLLISFISKIIGYSDDTDLMLDTCWKTILAIMKRG